MHSPDPWKLERLPTSTAVVASDGSIVMKHHYGTHQPNDPEFDMMAGNLERIVACVNFCRKIKTEELVDIVDRTQQTAPPLEQAAFEAFNCSLRGR